MLIALVIGQVSPRYITYPVLHFGIESIWFQWGKSLTLGLDNAQYTRNRCKNGDP